MLNSLLLKLDVLSPAPQLKVNKQSAYTTIAGGVISIIIFILTMTGVIYFGRELFLKEKPFVVTSDKDYSNFGPYAVDVDSFYYYVAIQDEYYNYYVDPTIFELSSSADTWEYDENGETKSTTSDVEIKLCNNYFNSTDELNISRNIVDLNKFYCVKPGSARVEGYWGGEINSFVSVFLNKCSNTTANNNHCKPEEEINKMIQGGQINVIVDNYALHMNDYLNPVVKSMRDTYYSLNVDFTMNMFFTLQTLSFTTDVGIMLEQFDEVVKFYIDEPHINYYGKRGNLLVRVDIQGWPIGKSVIRKYSKFQDVLTQVGGLIKAFMVLGSFIASLFSKIQFINDYLFNISVKDDEIQVKHPSPSKKVKQNNFLEDASKNNIKRTNDESKFNKTQGSYINKHIIRLPTHAHPSEKMINIKKEMRKPADKSTNISNVTLKSYTFSHYSIDKTNEMYPKSKAIKDFFIQLCGKKKHFLVNKKLILDKKISHALSIETLLEKMFVVEVLRNISLSDNQNILVNRLYYDIMSNRDGLSLQQNSDSIENIFGLSKDKLEEYFKS